jgi:hypothetical protein
MQSILGALLTFGYATAMTAAIASSPQKSQITTSVQNQLTKSFASAADTASQYPKYSQQIVSAAKTGFLNGADWAYTAGIVAVLLGAVLVFFMFPRRDPERELLAEYHRADTARVDVEEGVPS